MPTDAIIPFNLLPLDRPTGRIRMRRVIDARRHPRSPVHLRIRLLRSLASLRFRPWIQGRFVWRRSTTFPVDSHWFWRLQRDYEHDRPRTEEQAGIALWALLRDSLGGRA